MKTLKLIPLERGERKEIELFPYTIGRESFSDHLDCPPVLSRRHCSIIRSPGQRKLGTQYELIIKDEDTLNGTFVNGRRLYAGASTCLLDGDVLQLGKLRDGVYARGWKVSLIP